MEFEIKQQDSIYIMNIPKSLGIINMSEFKNQIKNLVLKGVKKLVLSFEHTRYLDSSGITALISMNTYMQEQSTAFRFVYMKGLVKQVFTIAHLELLFPISETMESAIEELKKES